MALAGSMSAGIAGLKSHMSALNVVGNNVANVNTYGYKAGRVTFRESVYSTQAAASDGTQLVGGTNPRQTGYGNSIGTVDLDMSTQGLEATGRALDLMIQGDGFFLLGDKAGVGVDALETLDFSRVGNLKFDQDGYLTDGAGNIVYGFMTANTDPVTGDISASTGLNGEEVSTNLVPIRLPLEATEAFLTANTTGGVLNALLTGAEVGDAIYPGVNATSGVNELGTALTDLDTLTSIEVESISIDQNGRIAAVNRTTQEPVLIGYVALGFVTNPAALTHTEGPYYKALGGTGNITIGIPGGEFSGDLNNGQAAGSTMVQTGTTYMPGFLEQSGTDLATEFANMIIYQRGYQANTRIVSVTDSMLEELVNMKR